MTISIQTISIKSALTIAQNTLECARAEGMKPIAVVVLDMRGAVKAYLADDGTSLLRFDIALGKAAGTLGMGLGGRELERKAVAAPHFMASLHAISNTGMVPVRGGVLIKNQQGQVIGAVGVSGDTSVNDELCALKGIESAGLFADHGDEEG
jgi:uncharacterized protein GlcG (DUF336 family)